MNYGLVFFIGTIIGAALGVIVMSFLFGAGDYDESVDAYNEGFMDGKRFASKNTDNVNNALDNEHNNIRY